MAVKENTYTSTSQALLLLLPTIGVLSLFLYYPSIETFYLSFHETFLLGLERTWVGVENYATLLTSARYRNSIGVSFLFGGIVVVGSIAISLVIAMFIDEVNRGKSIYLIGAIWPYAMPVSVAGILLLFLAHPTLGTYTHYVESLLGFEVEWFVSGWQALAVVALALIWKQIGYNVIFLLAALSSVPKGLKEAATVDGVPGWKRAIWVYVPMISPTIVFLVVMNTITAFFGSFAFIDLMTQGGPNNATNLLIYNLYKDAFEFDNLGAAGAQSMVLFLIVAVLTYVQLRISDRYTYYGG